jgi:hypothetical protein
VHVPLVLADGGNLVVPTFALVVVTAVAAVFTALAARSTSRLADAAKAELDLTYQQTQRAHRPVLVPFQRAEDVKFRGGTIPARAPHVVENPPDRQDLPPYSALFLPLENIGMGPALNVRGTFAGPYGNGEVPFPTEGVAAGQLGIVTFQSRAGESLAYTADHTTLTMRLLYEDVGGLEYTTDVEFAIGSNAYTAQLGGPL